MLIVDEAATALKQYGVRPDDRVMLVGENCLAVAALVLAVSELDAWSVVGNPRRSSGLVALGEVGELHIRGANVMRGYYRASDQNI